MGLCSAAEKTNSSMSNSHKASPEQRRALAQHARAWESRGNHLQPTVMVLLSKTEDPANMYIKTFYFLHLVLSLGMSKPYSC